MSRRVFCFPSRMKILLLAPALIAGLATAFWGGYWQGLIFVAASVLVQLGMLLGNRPVVVGERSAIQVVGRRVFLDGQRLPDRLARWPPQARLLLFRHVVESRSAPDRQRLSAALAAHSGRLPVLGFELADRDVAIELDWDARPHTLIVGPTGSGKSVLLGNLLGSIAEHIDAEIEAVWYFDPKAGHSMVAHSGQLAAMRERWPNARLERIAGAEPSKLADALSALTASLVHRQGESLARIVVVIEELSLALADRAVSQAIQALAAAGRTAGVRIIATNQTASGLPRNLLVNLNSRIVMAGSDTAEALLLAPPERSLGNSTLAHSGSQAGYEIDSAIPARAGVFRARLLNQNRDFSFLADWSS